MSFKLPKATEEHRLLRLKINGTVGSQCCRRALISFGKKALAMTHQLAPQKAPLVGTSRCSEHDSLNPSLLTDAIVKRFDDDGGSEEFGQNRDLPIEVVDQVKRYT